MRVHSFQYKKKAWSISKFPEVNAEKTLVLVFGASLYFEHPEPIQTLASFYAGSQLVGCSSGGEILGPTVEDETLSVAVVEFESTEFKVVYAEVEGTLESHTAGKDLAAALDRPGLRSVLILSDGVQVNGSELVRGLNSILPKSVIITGGMAADGIKFHKTWVIKDGLPTLGLVCAIGLYGNKIKISHGANCGWDLFGPERVITRSERNVLFELDGKPALQLYKEYLGERTQGLPATGLLFPLSIREKKTSTRRLARTTLRFDENKQSITFAGDLPQGWLAQMMNANFDKLLESATLAANQAKLMNSETSAPSLAIVISCLGRRMVLGERTEEEAEALLDALAPLSTQVGFYAYGEISPYTVGEPCYLQNQNVSLTIWSEG